MTRTTRPLSYNVAGYASLEFIFIYLFIFLIDLNKKNYPVIRWLQGSKGLKFEFEFEFFIYFLSNNAYDEGEHCCHCHQPFSEEP